MLPNNQIRLLHEAVSHQRAGRASEAIRIYNKILQKSPSNIDCINALAGLYVRQGDVKSAIPLFRRAAKLRPDIPDAHYNLAVALSMAGQHSEAAEHYNRVLEVNPRHVEARNNYAMTLLQTGQLREAANQFSELIAVEPRSAGAYNNRGMALQALKRAEDALADYDRAIAIEPRFAEAYVNRGNALAELQRSDEALESYLKSVALRPDLADAYTNIGNIYFQRNAHEEAIAAYDKGLSLKPSDSEAFSMRLSAKMHLADWSNFEAERSNAISRIKSGELIYPFVALAVSSSPEEQLHCAKVFAKRKFPPAEKPIWRGETYSHDRVRVAYISGDFREHPVANLMVGMLERHDRVRFDVRAISYGPDHDSDIRRRLKAALENFIDVRLESDQDIAALIRQSEVDIAIDLAGFTQGARPNLFARRPAPIQVNYLGYSGTLGSGCYDYIIADPQVIPPEETKLYAEQVVWLPDSYLITDASRPITEAAPGRSQLGLPERGFVFCCFNQTYKITPTIFDIWMGLLRQVDRSVLWLREYSPVASHNLRAESERRGVSAERLIFAPRASVAEHLARHQQADLFLDTVPYNAHSTATEALWAGLPVITCRGSSFAGRVGSSISHAIGMSELVTDSLSEYESLALKIAKDPALRTRLKEKLARNRKTHPLFDTALFTQHIETAYEQMWLRYRDGLLPAALTVKSSRS